jgi:hypothetical protein
LLRQLGNCQFHGTLDRDASDTFVFVDPTITGQSLIGFLAHSLQILNALFRPGFFVIASTRRRPNDREHNHAKNGKEKHDPEPRRPWSARMSNLTKRFGLSHVSSPSLKIQ